MLMIYLFLLMILMKSTYYKIPSKKIQFLTLLMNKQKQQHFLFRSSH